MSSYWIIIKNKRKRKNSPSEIKIDYDGNVFLDGELYDENDTKYKNLSLNVEKHSKLNTGEETDQMLRSKRDAKEGESVSIKDEKGPNRSESTTVQI